MVISEELMKAVKPFVDLAYAAQDVDMVAYNDNDDIALNATGAWSGACITKKQCRDLMSAYKNFKRALEPQGQALPELPPGSWHRNEESGDFEVNYSHDEVKEYGQQCYDAGRASQLALPAGPVPEELLAAAAEHAAHAMQKKCFDAGSEARICAIHFPPIIKAAVDAALASPSPPVADELEASDAYFKARHPMLDTTANRNVFSAGFRAALCQPAEEGGKA